MRLMLNFFFFFCLGILTLMAEKNPQHDESDEPALNAESLGKQNSDPSRGYRVASLKRGVQKNCLGRWHKLNSAPVCFGARNNQFGRFYVPSSGRLAGIKLVHLYGYVSCDTRKRSYWSYWGCGDNPWSGINNLVDVVITTSANRILLPPSQFIVMSTLKWSKIPGYNSLSPELVLSVFSHPLWVRPGQELRLWYGEDVVNRSEGDNGGRACCDVYALFV